jgi:cell division protein FtsZ
MGTVLDPEMRDEIRVTVVATGLNRVQPARMTAPVAPVVTQPRVSLVGRQRPVESDYPQPARMVAGMGGRASAAAAVATAAVAGSEPARAPVDDYLDIPAFLRRQAD